MKKQCTCINEISQLGVYHSEAKTSEANMDKNDTSIIVVVEKKGDTAAANLTNNDLKLEFAS